MDDYSLMRHEFLDDIESFHENRNGNFDHLLICRDIAFSGEKEQYKGTVAFQLHARRHSPSQTDGQDTHG